MASDFLAGLSDLALPEMHLVRQRFPAPRVHDLRAVIDHELARPEVAASLKQGARAAIAVGSRGIAHLAEIVGALVAGLKRHGVVPFIVPAMGSHGGATAAGQTAVLTRYGVDARCGAEVRSAMDTEVVGLLRRTADGYAPASAGEPDCLDIHCDRIAAREADLIIPVARVKPHTGFRGAVESGICKMLAIGLAKHVGCSRLHREGYGRFAALIPAAAARVLATGKIGFALAILENAVEETAHLEAVPAARILEREPELLGRARDLQPRILLPRIDVLVVERIGKDVSGVGMDANVIGRSELGRLAGFDGPEIARIVALDLTDATAGNASGVGMADIVTERLFSRIDRAVTYTNVFTSGSLAGGKIPVAAPDERRAILAAASCVPGVDPERARIVRIRDTLHLGEIAVSANLVEAVRGIEGCEVVGRFSGWTG